MKKITYQKLTKLKTRTKILIPPLAELQVPMWERLHLRQDLLVVFPVDYALVSNKTVLLIACWAQMNFYQTKKKVPLVFTTMVHMKPMPTKTPEDLRM